MTNRGAFLIAAVFAYATGHWFAGFVLLCLAAVHE